MPQTSPHTLATRLLTWFDQAGRRDLPWRDAPCGERNPYRVWLAEIMLQQTTCAAVIPYFLDFIAKWPDVKALAAADADDVMRAWAGLGYYARARNMLKCARTVADGYQGMFPKDAADLITLPGIGPYTAAAIAAIAHQRPSAPVDGNVIRVLTRLYAISDVMPANKDVVGAKAEKMLPLGRSGDFAEALMDLGATVCKPKNPLCDQCPWQCDCLAYGEGAVIAYPQKAPKKEKPTRRGWAFWVVRDDGKVLLERRPDKGLLGGMMGFPTTPWECEEMSPEQAVQWMPGRGDWQAMDKTVRHTFTHFHLELKVMRSHAQDPAMEGYWCAPDCLKNEALPTVMKKVYTLLV